MSSTTDLLNIAQDIVQKAKPGEQLEVVTGRGAGTSVRVYKGDIESLSTAESAAIGIRVIVDGKQGFASAGSLEENIVNETLDEARDNVQFAEYDEHVKLAEPDGVEAVDMDLWRESVLTTTTEAKIDMAMELEKMVMSGDPRITGVRVVGYGDSAGESALASTTGMAAYTRGTSCSVGASALASQDEETQIGYGSDVQRQPGDLDLSYAANDAVQRATRLLGAQQPASRRIALVLEPRLAATIMSIVGGMLSGERVLKGRTPFADRIGESIANPLVTLVDDATDLESFGASSYDGEGLACRRLSLIDAGVLRGFMHNTYSASRAGSASTASAVRGARSTPGVGWQALSIAPGTGSLDDLIAQVDDGLLVQSMAGLHSGVNAVSGDFSVGAEGITIRNGQLAEPVREATIASTLPKLLTSIRAVGADIERLPGGVTSVSLLVDDVSLSGS